MVIKDFEQANAALAVFVHRGRGQYTLARMRKLMSGLGDPQNNLKVVHVAGTAGKTSTCYYLAALLAQGGAQVGMTVSPHIDEVNERIQIGGVPLAEAKFCRLLSEFLALEVVSETKPTYFELLVAFAFWVFAKEQVDYAVVEVGLGGLLDGTNVIANPNKICVITDIGIDHTQVLGNSLSEIATQKAGIIQQGNVVFTFARQPQVLSLLQARASEVGAKLHALRHVSRPTKLLPIQQKNWDLAWEVFKYLSQRDGLVSINDKQKVASQHMLVPGRLERRHVGGKTVVLDGAHNPAKIAALATSLAIVFKGQSCTVVFGMVETKRQHVAECLELLRPLSNVLIVTAFMPKQDLPHRAIDPVVLAQAAKEQGYRRVIVEPDAPAALRRALSGTTDNVLVTGSFYLLSEIHKVV